MELPIGLIIFLLIVQLGINFSLSQVRKEKNGTITKVWNRLFWISFILSVFFAVTLIRRIYKIKNIESNQVALIGKIDTLKSNLIILEKENKSLQNTQLKADSLLSKVNLKFEDQSITLQYSEMATLNCFGLKAGVAESGAFTKQYANLYTKMRQCIDSNQPIPHLLVSDLTEKYLLEIVNDFPSFPFSYYYLGEYFQSSDSIKSNKYFTKAHTILKRTVQIPGHKSDHDIFLELLVRNQLNN